MSEGDRDHQAVLGGDGWSSRISSATQSRRTCHGVAPARAADAAAISIESARSRATTSTRCAQRRRLLGARSGARNREGRRHRVRRSNGGRNPSVDAACCAASASPRSLGPRNDNVRSGAYGCRARAPLHRWTYSTALRARHGRRLRRVATSTVAGATSTRVSTIPMSRGAVMRSPRSFRLKIETITNSARRC